MLLRIAHVKYLNQQTECKCGFKRGFIYIGGYI